MIIIIIIIIIKIRKMTRSRRRKGYAAPKKITRRESVPTRQGPGFCTILSFIIYHWFLHSGRIAIASSQDLGKDSMSKFGEFPTRC